MKRFIAGLVALATAAQLGLARTDAEYVNNGLVTDAPQIDAKLFLNRGTFNLSGVDLGSPFGTLNTETFLNYGSISASPGMRFEYVNSKGVASPATLFTNAPNARVIAVESQGRFGLFNTYRDAAPSYLDISAVTVKNRGLLQASIGGEISISGDDVDLSNSAVDIRGFAGGSNSGGGTGTGFPLAGMRDVFWQYEQVRVPYGDLFAMKKITNVVLGVTKVDNAINVSALTFPVTDSKTTATSPTRRGTVNLETPGRVNILGRDVLPFVWITTNPPSGSSPTNPATNQIITVVLVKRHDTNVLVDAVAFSGLDPVNAPLPTVNLRFTKVSTNLITGLADATVLKLSNTYGSAPDTLLVTNYVSGNTFWPTNITFSRETIAGVPNPGSSLISADPVKFNAAVTNLLAAINARAQFTQMSGNPTNTPLRTNIFTAWTGGGITNVLTYTNNAATNPFVAYSASFDFAATAVPKPANVPDASTTNLAGRITINAKKLDLTKVRMRGQGPVVIKADNLTGNAGATVDAPYVDADFGSDSGNLSLSGIFRTSVERLRGTNAIFSTLWTNTVDYTFTVTNAPVNAGDPPTTTDTTVTLTSIFHYMMVDSDLIGEFQTPTVDLKLRATATNVVLGDNFLVNRFTAVAADSLTVNGRLNVVGSDLGTRDWNAASFPNLRFLTNNGTITVPNEMVLGSDRDVAYTKIWNLGSITAGYFSAKADLFLQEVAGSITTSSGPVFLEGHRYQLAGSISAPGRYVRIDADQIAFAFPGPLAITTDFFELDAKESIESSPSFFSLATTLGFTVHPFPAATSTFTWNVEVTAPAFQEAVISWPGVDRGVVPGDDTRIAGLKLDGGFGSSFRFLRSAAKVDKGAIYVDSLTLSPNLVTTNSVTKNLVLTGDFNVADNVVIYFATANVPAKQLSDLPGSPFRWLGGAPAAANAFALVNGKRTAVQTSLRYSALVDSDGDGIVNALDETPFEGVVVENAKVLTDGAPGFRITWEASAHQAYEVQYTTDASFGDWKTLQRVSNDSNDHQTLWVRDPIAEGDGARAYRVVYAQ
ncbi:MAG: hypothetical protein DVB31_09140 [Verrucomicrobia bacterium]|nr:MAG: hypothetical protein DVB31_09140 [Verrucomicrobiota bacterium]